LDGSVVDAEETNTMMRDKRKLRILLVVLACFFSSCGAVQATEGLTLRTRLTETIVKVRTGATSNIRDAAAQHLFDLTRGVDPQAVDDETIAKLVSLLDLPEGRGWVAASLGNLGRRARIAVPKLEEILPEEECRHEDLTAEGAIRHALKRMGVKSPPYSTCEYGTLPISRRQLTEAIQKVRTGDSTVVRVAAAEYLAYLIRYIDPREADDETITSLTSLLDAPDELVRHWVALSLGYLGPQAKGAIPKLEGILADLCRHEDENRAAAFRYALEQMGARLPPECREYHAPSHQ
jgi:HEAT repeat protein